MHTKSYFKKLDISSVYICLVVFLILSTTTEANNVLIIGSDTLSLNTIIEQTNKNSRKIIGIAPNFSFENPYNAVEKIPHDFRDKMKSQNVFIDKTADSLITHSNTVILLSENGCLDFNSAIKILTEKKNLILEQPQNFHLSDAIVLFALSQKYRVDIEVFVNKNLEYLNNFSNKEIKVVKKKNEEITLISKNKTFTYYPRKQNLCNGEENNTKLKTISQLWDEQRNIHERDYLYFFTLINVLEKCEAIVEQDINIAEEYIHAFNSAYFKMNKFN